ncbi:MAG: hypothetical protein C4542_02960 [Dehalococcoidia bacterium]|nr:MAG: hypothetical protein C4542_02960 [Dehalococcoidia bacterium]
MRPRRNFSHITPGWYENNGRRIYMRSGWELKYAAYLDLMVKAGEIKSWEYEPTTYWFPGIMRGVCSYKPDFEVVYRTGRIELHEVKGYQDARNKTALKRMAKYYPKIKVVLLTGDRLKGLLKSL